MALDSIRGSLKDKGVRLTRQRQILLELIDKSGQHLDAENLFQMAKEKDPKLNRVTVYRTLKLLKEGGLVDELDLMHYGGDQHYYETRTKQEHAHIICLRCGKVEEFFGEPLQRLRRQIEAHFGFQIVLARTEVGGYCSHCQVLRAAVAATERAAKATAGRLLLRDGVPASVYYSASCGGRTQLPSDVWPGADDPPYLPSKEDDACQGAPAWTAELHETDLQRALRASGFRGDAQDQGQRGRTSHHRRRRQGL